MFVLSDQFSLHRSFNMTKMMKHFETEIFNTVKCVQQMQMADIQHFSDYVLLIFLLGCQLNNECIKDMLLCL